MASVNRPSTRSHVYTEERLAGGMGPHGAMQSEEMQLRRLVMACLLWEDNAYCDGKSVVESIKALIPKVDPDVVAAIAVEADEQQKLRHVPLLVVREMARHASHKSRVRKTLARVVRRPDEMTEFLAIYFGDKTRKEEKLSKQVQRGLADAFQKFSDYQLRKYASKCDGKTFSLRDVLFLTHAMTGDIVAAGDRGQQNVINGGAKAIQRADYRRGDVARHADSLASQLVAKTLLPADTWEVGLSAAKSVEEKRAVWTRLIQAGHLPAFAFLKNLRNMVDVAVPRDVIAVGMDNLQPAMLLPLDFLKAAVAAPDWRLELERLMLRCAAEYMKLPGWTVFVVDVSGSMGSGLSSKSSFTRLEAAAAMAILAAEMCQHVTIYATAGSDAAYTHRTVKVAPARGFALSDAIVGKKMLLGGGGIFTRQCLEYIQALTPERPDRIVVFSDSQDCDRESARRPSPFGVRNYIVDVSCEKHGVNYLGDNWTAEISGWSASFLQYIAAMEASDQNAA